MEHKVYSIWDSKAKVYANPMIDINGGTFMRKMKDLVDNPEHVFNKHAADFTVFEIATYEDSTGQFQPYEKKINLGEMQTLKEI